MSINFYLFADSSTSVTLNPEWSYKDTPKKIESRRRTTDGSEYVYTWATYREFEVPVMYVSSADAYQIEQWWENNTELKWMQDGGTVHDVKILGSKSPLTERSMPYIDKFKGTINLGTF